MKYLCPLTDPSFLPAGLSNSIPYQVPGKRLKFTHTKNLRIHLISILYFSRKKTLNMIHVSPYGDIKISEFIKFSIKTFKAFYDLISPNI